jgi:hypothetical protein
VHPRHRSRRPRPRRRRTSPPRPRWGLSRPPRRLPTPNRRGSRQPRQAQAAPAARQEPGSDRDEPSSHGAALRQRTSRDRPERRLTRCVPVQPEMAPTGCPRPTRQWRPGRGRTSRSADETVDHRRHDAGLVRRAAATFTAASCGSGVALVKEERPASVTRRSGRAVSSSSRPQTAGHAGPAVPVSQQTTRLGPDPESPGRVA